MAHPHVVAVRGLLWQAFAHPDPVVQMNRMAQLLETDMLGHQLGLWFEPGVIIGQSLIFTHDPQLRIHVADAIGALLAQQLHPARAQAQSNRLLYNLLVVASHLARDMNCISGHLGTVLCALRTEQRERGGLFYRVYNGHNLDHMLAQLVDTHIR